MKTPVDSPPTLLQKIGKSSWGWIIAILFVGGLLFAGYSDYFHNSFHFDDDHVVENNLYIRSLKNIPKFFVDGRTHSNLPANSVYRPLVSVTLALDYFLGGGIDPWQFHVTQFALHLILGILLYFFYLKILNTVSNQWWNRYIALFTTGLFCLHTANTETLNIISVRSELISAIGVIWAFLVYLSYPRLRRYYLYLLPIAFGALAKSPAVMFAPLLFTYVLLFEENVSIPEALKKPSHLMKTLRATFVAFIIGLLLFKFVESMNPPGQTLGGGDRIIYLKTQFFVWVHYFRLFFLPLGLTADTDWSWVTHWYDTRVWAGLCFLSFFLWLIWQSSKSQRLRPTTFGLLWYLTTLLPASSLFPLAEVYNEHRIFLPYIGLTLAVVWGGANFVKTLSRPRLVFASWIVALLILGGHAWGTYHRNEVWKTEETLWYDVSQKSPLNGRGLMNYGLSQMGKGKYQEARDLFERALTLTPNYSVLETNLGIVYSHLNDQKKAEEHFLKSLQLEQNNGGTLFFYARWLVEQERAPEAINILEKAVKISPNAPAPRSLLMNLYAAIGETEKVRQLAQQTLQLVEDDPYATALLNGRLPFPVTEPTYQAYFNLGIQLYQQGLYAESAQAYRKALELDPKSANAWNNLGWTMGKLGFNEMALNAFRETLRITPDSELALNNFKMFEQKIGKTIETLPAGLAPPAKQVKKRKHQN